jgi:hypothetical protein
MAARTYARVLLVAAIGCRPAPVRAPEPPAPVIRVDAPTCVAAEAVRTRVERVLHEHDAERSGLVVDVSVTPGDASADVALRVVRPRGDVGLDRHYALSPADCASAPDLIAIVVDRWLTDFPEWAQPPPPSSSLPSPSRWTDVLATVTVSGIAPPLGVEGQLGALVDRGGDGHRFGLSGVVRTGLPQDAGDGRFRQIALLAGATWRRSIGAWELRAELRGGALRVSGIGFFENDTSWLAWWEVALFGGRAVSFGAIGLELAATAQRDHAVTGDGLVSQDIPLIRLGLSGTFEIR